MSRLVLGSLRTWLISALAFSTVTALPQSTGIVANDKDVKDNDIVVQINEGGFHFAADKGELALRVNGSDGSSITINTMNHRFGNGPIIVYRANIQRAPTDYGCYFWTSENTGTTTTFPASRTPPNSSFSPGVPLPASAVSQTFYTDSTGITIDNTFLNGEFLSCFPLTGLKGPILGSKQNTYDIVGIYVGILAPRDPNHPVELGTGNARFLVAPFVPIRLEPDMTSLDVSDAKEDIASGSENIGGLKKKVKEKHKMIGFYSFPDNVMLKHAAVVHATNPNVRCQATGQKDEDVGPEFLVDTPLPSPITVVKGILCYY